MKKEDREREALQIIQKIVGQLGLESYVGAALEGALDLAESNIQDCTYDTAQYFMEKSWEVEKQAHALKKERDALRVAARSSSTRRKVPLHNIKDIYREFYTRLEKADKDDIATPAQEAADAVLEYLEGMDIARTDILAIEALVNTYAITVEEEAFSNGFKAAALLLDREETAKC